MFVYSFNKLDFIDFNKSNSKYAWWPVGNCRVGSATAKNWVLQLKHLITRS